MAALAVDLEATRTPESSQCQKRKNRREAGFVILQGIVLSMIKVALKPHQVKRPSLIKFLSV